MVDEALKIDRHIEGDITYYSSKQQVEQWDKEQFLSVLDELLAVEGVEAVRWEQYTPYFNDGEACEFMVYEPQIKFAGDEESGDYEDGFIDSWGLTYQQGKEFPYKPENVTAEQAERADAAIRAAGIGSGHFDDVLLANFGDPAQVTATKEGFSVEYYDHD